jgi:hypothetical protein
VDGLTLELAFALDTAPTSVWKWSQTPDRITAATNVTANAPAAALTGGRLGRGAPSSKFAAGVTVLIPPLGGHDTAFISARNSVRSLQTRETREVFRTWARKSAGITKPGHVAGFQKSALVAGDGFEPPTFGL